jgi:hypothetical protein
MPTYRLARTALAGLGAILGVALGIPACASSERRFPLRAPLWQDTDLRSVSLPCRFDPTKKDRAHISCAPKEYVSPLVWDGIDNMIFRPVARAFAVDPGGEAVNVNSLDEVPDSAWFTNRLGIRPMSSEELMLGACEPSFLLDPEAAAEGTWVIDSGKGNGSSAGFRVNIPGKGKYMFKAEPPDQPERPSAASVIGAAVYNAVGFYTSCERIVYYPPSVLKLTPGLRYASNLSEEKDFDQKALDKIINDSPKRGKLTRVQASAWLPGRLIGPFRYEGTRPDDPNDVIPHEDRRELRGGRLLAAWLDHFDAREQNTMDSWIADRAGQPDSSPGSVRHYYLDTSDCLGSEWEWDAISRRLGMSYIFDWGDIGADFITLGIPLRPWDRVKRKPGQEIFGYFNVEDFVPENWKNEYPNAAFSRMTERDGAWMARILSRFTPEMVNALARMADLSDPRRTAYLAFVLEGRLERILGRYLTRLSPVAEVHLEGVDQLCGVDLAELRRVREAATFHYVARFASGAPLPVTLRGEASVCATLPRVAGDGGSPDDATERYFSVTIEDGVAKGALVAHLYDLGAARGYRLVALERPEP